MLSCACLLLNFWSEISRSTREWAGSEEELSERDPSWPQWRRQLDAAEMGSVALLSGAASYFTFQTVGCAGVFQCFRTLVCVIVRTLGSKHCEKTGQWTHHARQTELWVDIHHARRDTKRGERIYGRDSTELLNFTHMSRSSITLPRCCRFKTITLWLTRFIDVHRRFRNLFDWSARLTSAAALVIIRNWPTTVPWC